MTTQVRSAIWLLGVVIALILSAWCVGPVTRDRSHLTPAHVRVDGP